MIQFSQAKVQQSCQDNAEQEEQKSQIYGNSLNQNDFSNRLVEPTNAFNEFLLEDIEQSIASRFETQVRKYPDQLAIKDKIRQFTYSQLNQFANQIAYSIVLEHGSQEDPVAIFFEQGALFLATIFGVLKTGKFYVPIDPSFPEARNSYILEDSQAKLIVTNHVNLQAAESLASGNYQILNIDDIDPSTPVDNLNLAISPNTLAYIIYTSGSTGKPKGVFQNQRNVLHNCMNQTNAFHLEVGDRMPLVHSCSVMGAVRVIYNALLNGVSLYPLDVQAEGLTALRNLLNDEEITVFHSVATLFRHFADIFTGADQFPSLRLVILGGEAMSRKDVELYKRQFPGNCLLCTGLGSTEAGTIRVFMLDKQAEIKMSLVPPGYAVPGMEVLLLNDDGSEVEPGCVGEIVIRSPYLALGYWRRPDLTEAAFLPDPQGGQGRIFRTGDMGYFLPDGCLVHAGRKDFQVKIRGYRVNVSEIEMALLDYGFIKEAVVVGREDTSGETYLVAYIVPRQQPAPTSSELRNFIARQLPSYMIPSCFVTLDALPLTANGKVNRLAFPAPEQIAPELVNQFVAPRNSIEQSMANIWARMLKLEKVGIHDNFFELGGHSLIAVQLFHEIEKLLGRKPPLAILFQAPTIEDFAKAIGQDDCAPLWSPLVPIQPKGNKPPLFCIHPIGGNVLEYELLARHLGVDQPVYGLQARGLDGNHTPLERIEDMATLYVEEIRRFQPEGPYFLAGYSFGGLVAFEMAQQLYAQGEKDVFLALLDRSSPNFQDIRPYPLTVMGIHLNNLRNLAFREKLEYIKGGILFRTVYKGSYKHALTDVGIEHVPSVYINIMKSNIQAREAYTGKVYSGKVNLFRCQVQRSTRALHPDLGWSELVTGGVEIHHIPGLHNKFLSQELSVRMLAEKLRFCLEKYKSTADCR
jgi:amino acid adenylation domain-containing protein